MVEHAQPSTANIAIACAIIGGVTGYFIGQAKSLGLFGGSPISEGPLRKKDKKGAETSDESSDEEEDEEENNGDLATEFPGHNEECKLVLVVRTDLGMTKGTLYTLPQSPNLYYIYLTPLFRQNRRTMRPRDSSLLQAPPPYKLPHPATLGTQWTGKGCSAS